MRKVGSYEARTHLSELLDEVAKGERVAITKHGHPVAMLVPFEKEGTPDRREFIKAMTEFRKGRKLQGITIRGLIAEGRRW